MTPDQVSQQVKADFYADKAVAVYKALYERVAPLERATMRAACFAPRRAVVEEDYATAKAKYDESVSAVMKRIVQQRMEPSFFDLPFDSGKQIIVSANPNDFWCDKPFVVVVIAPPPALPGQGREAVNIRVIGRNDEALIRVEYKNTGSNAARFPTVSRYLDRENATKDSDTFDPADNYAELRSKELCP